MSFLDPFLGFRETSGNFLRGDGEVSLTESEISVEVGHTDVQLPQTPQMQMVPYRGGHLATSTPTPTPAPTRAPAPSAAVGKKRPAQEQLTTFETKLLGAVESLRPVEDEDELFFKSLIPTLKRLTPSRKADLKLAFMRMVNDAEREEEFHEYTLTNL